MYDKLQRYFNEDYLFIKLNVIVIIINKYVLSVLNFTIPTVYQGWQTLVCVLILTVLALRKKLSDELQFLDGPTCLRLLFPLISFTVANVAGSKALADLPIPIFLAGSNLVPCISYFLTSSYRQLSVRACGSAAICGTVLALFVVSSSVSSIPAWFWLSVHVIAIVCQSWGLGRLQLTHINAVTIIYYRNFSSIVLLLPLSIYLEEASSALKYSHLADVEFMAGCLLSGVLGTALQFLNTRLEEKKSHSVCVGVSKIVCSFLGWVIFYPPLSSVSWCLIVANLIMASVFFYIDEGGEIVKGSVIV